MRRVRGRTEGPPVSGKKNRLTVALETIALDLSELDRKYALVGGLAVSVRAEPRLTRDVDLAVVVQDDRDAEALVYALTQRGYAVLFTIENDLTTRLSMARLGSPKANRVMVDLLFAATGIESVIVDGAEPILLPGNLTLPVAKVEHLIAMKVLARDDRKRPQDYDDLQALLSIATAEEKSAARVALQAIEQAGVVKNRQLVLDFEALLTTPIQ